MYSKMEMPKYSNLVKLVAQIGALIGVVFGVISCAVSLPAFKYGAFAGFSGIFAGIMTIIGSLASLGIVYCFLALVEAQIDTRNAILSNFSINPSQGILNKQNEVVTYNDGNFSSDERVYD
jgi:hypothetical protein